MLNIHHLTISTGKRLLIDQLACQVAPGECWAILGKNGTGKTTLLRTLSALRKPDSGDVELHGKTLSQWDPISLARQRAYLPQKQHDAFSYSVLQSVMAGRHPYHARNYWETETDMQAVDMAMQQMDVISLAERDIRFLSGGERQRVALASVLAQDTPLLLLDEPVNSLDLAHQVSFMQLVRNLCQVQKKSVMMVIHDLNLVHNVATHALLLQDGGNWYAGEISEVMEEQKLSECLGYPVKKLCYEGRPVYIPM